MKKSIVRCSQSIESKSPQWKKGYRTAQDLMKKYKPLMEALKNK